MGGARGLGADLIGQLDCLLVLSFFQVSSVGYALLRS